MTTTTIVILQMGLQLDNILGVICLVGYMEDLWWFYGRIICGDGCKGDDFIVGFYKG